MRKKKGFVEILEEFHKKGIKYIIVGGVAVNLHGIPRMTYDLDILLKMEDENLEKFINLMERWGYKPKVPVKIHDFIKKEKREAWIKNKNMKAFTLFNPDAVVKEIDVVINSPLDYEKAIKNVKYIKSKRVKIPVAGIKDLIKMKKNTKREQDISDVRYLKKLLEYEKGV